MPNTAGSPNVKILLGGTPAADSDFLSYVVERDMYQPDMAAVVLSNQGDIYSGKAIGSPLEVQVGDDSTPIFKGDIVGLEPIYKGGEKTKILIRGMNKFHRLLRKRKSMTYTDKSDKDILSDVVKSGGLTLEWEHDVNITYKHVYQHNQTDMEFLRTRAARMGCHVWCVDTKLFCKKPDLDSGPIGELKVDQSSDKGALKSFSARLNSAAIVKKVTVKGWNPETKELITGDASAESSKLGSQNAAAASGDLAGEETFTVDHPIWSREEATAIAKARLRDSALTFITGEAEVTGDPKFDLGKIVKILANEGGEGAGEDPFNGLYYIMGVTHRHLASKSKEGGYTTILRLARDAQKVP